jgi:hypothetical protein
MPKLIDCTVADRRTGKTDEWGKVHAIYLTADGKDYCREDGPVRIATHDEAAAWAQSHFDRVADLHARQTVTGFRIEFW